MILRVIYYYFFLFFFLCWCHCCLVCALSFLRSTCSSSVISKCHCAELNTRKIEENLIRVTINKWLKNPPIHYNSKGAAQIRSNVLLRMKDENLSRFSTWNFSFPIFHRELILFSFAHILFTFCVFLRWTLWNLQRLASNFKHVFVLLEMEGGGGKYEKS